MQRRQWGPDAAPGILPFINNGGVWWVRDDIAANDVVIGEMASAMALRIPAFVPFFQNPGPQVIGVRVNGSEPMGAAAVGTPLGIPMAAAPVRAPSGALLGIPLAAPAIEETAPEPVAHESVAQVPGIGAPEPPAVAAPPLLAAQQARARVSPPRRLRQRPNSIR